VSDELALLGRMLDHLAWADERVARALAAADSVPPATLTLMAHLVAAEHIWHARLTGTTPAHPVWPTLSLEQATRLGRATVEALRSLVASMSLDDLHRGVSYANSTGTRFTTPAIDIVTHLCLHGAYHRGQIATTVRQAGGVPISTDYIQFVRETVTPPAPR